MKSQWVKSLEVGERFASKKSVGAMSVGEKAAGEKSLGEEFGGGWKAYG